jgi:DNA-binding NarL/FixJ family response regulator
MPRSIERAKLVELEAEGEQMTAMAENSRKPWTAEDERLRQLVVSGASVGEIAEKLDR